MEKEMGNELLTVQEAADLLRVHRNTIYAMIHDGRLPAFKVGRAWRIRFEDLPNAKPIGDPVRLVFYQEDYA